MPAMPATPATPPTPPTPTGTEEVEPSFPLTQAEDPGSQPEPHDASPQGIDLAEAFKDDLVKAPRENAKKRVRRSLSKCFEEDHKSTGLTDSDDEDIAKFPRCNLLPELQLPQQADGASRFETNQAKDPMDVDGSADAHPRLLPSLKRALASGSAHNARAAPSVSFKTPNKQDSSDEDIDKTKPAKLNLFRSTVEFYSV